MPYKPETFRAPWIPKKETGAFTGYAKKNKKFYNSKAWKLTRRQALERDDFCCVICKRDHNRMVEAKIVDHIIPINDTRNRGKELCLSLDNLQSLCVRCNAQKTRLDRNDL